MNWVVGGGETGGHERMTDPDWFRSLRDQCRWTGAMYFQKQMTARAPIPFDLQVRNYPTVYHQTAIVPQRDGTRQFNLF